MCVIRGTKKIQIIPRINPYLTLGIKKNASHSETKTKFRLKMNEARNDDILRAKICLAYDVIVNKEFYRCEGDDIYTLKDDYTDKNYYYIYYSTVIGDTLNLIKIIENENDFLYYKDPLKRSLLYIAARNGHVKICE